ncbi:MAG: hypothetical protein WCL18_04925 [bacterium]
MVMGSVDVQLKLNHVALMMFENQIMSHVFFMTSDHIYFVESYIHVATRSTQLYAIPVFWLNMPLP